MLECRVIAPSPVNTETLRRKAQSTRRLLRHRVRSRRAIAPSPDSTDKTLPQSAPRTHRQLRRRIRNLHATAPSPVNTETLRHKPQSTHGQAHHKARNPRVIALSPANTRTLRALRDRRVHLSTLKVHKAQSRRAHNQTAHGPISRRRCELQRAGLRSSNAPLRPCRRPTPWHRSILLQCRRIFPSERRSTTCKCRRVCNPARFRSNTRITTRPNKKPRRVNALAPFRFNLHRQSAPKQLIPSHRRHWPTTPQGRSARSPCRRVDARSQRRPRRHQRTRPILPRQPRRSRRNRRTSALPQRRRHELQQHKVKRIRKRASCRARIRIRRQFTRRKRQLQLRKPRRHERQASCVARHRRCQKRPNLRRPARPAFQLR